MELADELGVSTRAVKATCERLGIEAAWAGADLSAADAQRVREAGATEPPTAPFQPPPEPLIQAPATDAIVRPGLGAFARPDQGAGLPFGAGTEAGPPSPRVAIVSVTQRDATIGLAWQHWWKALAIGVATWMVGFGLALVMDETQMFADAYRQRVHTFGGRDLFFVAAILIVGTAWSTIVAAEAARTALDAWPRITMSNGQITGQAAIIGLVTWAVLSTIWLIVTLFGTAWLLTHS